MNQELTLYVEADVLRRAREYAQRNNTSVEHLVTTFLRQLAEPGDELHPAIQGLRGILPVNTAESDYEAYLEEKYLD